jgi:MoxR-like ATPase
MSFPSTVEPQLKTNDRDVALLEQVGAIYQSVSKELGQRIVGQKEVIRDLFVSILARGHCLMVGVPGLAKTLLVKSLAEILDLDFRRIQFTPDLMPGDITGSEILEETHDGKRTFRFVPGPLFTQLLLADEINRTPPKTQAALLEAMQEKSVTVSGKTYALQSPFFVLATQNPIEQEGTYSLPEAQLDRFMFNLKIEYPSVNEEVDILLRTTGDAPEPLAKVLTGEQIVALQRAISKIPVPKTVAEYAVNLVYSTRPVASTASKTVQHYVQWGAGPRASQYLAMGGKVLAALDGRFNVAREDIETCAKLVLRHRIITNFRAEADSITTDHIIDGLLKK